jgi:hypothetical protein
VLLIVLSRLCRYIRRPIIFDGDPILSGSRAILQFEGSLVAPSSARDTLMPRRDNKTISGDSKLRQAVLSSLFLAAPALICHFQNRRPQ